MEHHSNIVPWHFIRQRQGAKLVWAPVDDLGVFHVEAFEKCLTPRTTLVAITQMSNALGTVTPIKEIVRIAHARGIPVLVDGSQSAVHMPVDVQDSTAISSPSLATRSMVPGHRSALRQEGVKPARSPFLGGGEMIEEVTQDIVTITIRRTVEPARRRSSRRSGWALHSTIWKRSVASASPRTRPI
jgi:cysteine desulfurase/selenocysteine lyase